MLLLFIDIDGTLVDDIIPYLEEYYNLLGNKSSVESLKPKLIHALYHGLMRPHITLFLQTLSKQQDNFRLYIYTASDNTEGWVDFLIHCIEEVTSVKFERPLFTRAHCVKISKYEYYKSFAHVYSKINRKPYLKGNTKESILNNMILIDNTPMILCDSGNLIVCETYKSNTYDTMVDKLFWDKCYKYLTSEKQNLKHMYYKKFL